MLRSEDEERADWLPPGPARLRGIAIALVLAAHFFNLAGGFYGVAVFAFTLVLAALSYHVVEQPFRRDRRRAAEAPGAPAVAS